MSDQSPPPVYSPGIPAQRTSFDHAMAPDPNSLVYLPVEVVAPEPYAHWWQRVVATLIDSALLIPFAVAMAVGLVIAGDASTLNKDAGGTITSITISSGTWVGVAIAGVAYLAMTIFGIWNSIVRQGKHGASIGKSCMNLMVVSEADGQPIGAMMTFVRQLLHLVDQLPLYLGYLWPLWDRKRQTFADMIVNTVVLHLPPEPPVQVPAQAAAPYYS